MGKRGKTALRVQPTAVKEKLPPVTMDDFVKACLAVEDSSDMQTILEKKVKKHYSNCDPHFVKSSAFSQLVRSAMSKLENDKSNVYVHISELIQELKARKGHGEVGTKDDDPPSKKKRKVGPAEVDYNAIEDGRDALKIKKLNKTLFKLQKMIEDLETKEVSWEDDDDSTYMMLQRYKARAVKVFEKLCEYTKESKSAGSINKIHLSATPFPQVNKCVERFVNQTGQFPDFVDILGLIKTVNDEENLNLPETEMEDIAKTAFKEVGELLQRNRRHGVAESLLALVDGAGSDPADDDDVLKEELVENKKHWQKMDELINEFATKGKQKKGSGSDDKGSENDEDDDDNEDDDGDDDDEEDDDIILALSSDEDDGEEEEAAILGESSDNVCESMLNDGRKSSESTASNVDCINETDDTESKSVCEVEGDNPEISGDV